MNNLNSRNLHFEGRLLVSCMGTESGRSGGMCLMWCGTINLSLSTLSSNHISASIRKDTGTKEWHFMGIYG